MPDVTIEQPATAAADRGERAQAPRTGSRLRAPRHRLLLVCTGVLAAGLFGVLLLNTIISQGAFRQHELEVALILTAEKEEALARQVQQAEAPIEVEKRARALGMVPAGAPVFLRLSDGAILGEPVPAPAPTGPIDFADAPGLQPVPPTADATASPGAIDPALDPATGLSGTATPAADPAASAPATGPGASPAATPQASGAAVAPAPAPSDAASA
ncbi:MAG TPA: hypothetical protein VF143_04625, partial [Candidatus Nanopelagicales bacterium]